MDVMLYIFLDITTFIKLEFKIKLMNRSKSLKKKGFMPLDTFIKLVIVVIVALIIIAIMKEMGGSVKDKSISVFDRMTEHIKKWGVVVG